MLAPESDTYVTLSEQTRLFLLGRLTEDVPDRARPGPWARTST